MFLKLSLVTPGSLLTALTLVALPLRPPNSKDQPNNSPRRLQRCTKSTGSATGVSHAGPAAAHDAAACSAHRHYKDQAGQDTDITGCT